MSVISGGNCYINNHTLYHQEFDFNNGDVSSVNCCINSHTLSQCGVSITFKDICGNVKNDDLSSG